MPTLRKLFYKRDDVLLLRTVLQKTQKPLRTHCQIKIVSELRMPLLCLFHVALKAVRLCLGITSSIEILETDLLSKYNFKEVGLAGHPEGNPDVKQIDLDKAIIEKNKFSKKTDFKMYLATQFFFEAKSLKEWEMHLQSLDNNLEIHAGIPGPATLKTLLSYATSCGIGNSIRFLSKQALNITKLATTRSPDKLIYDLASYQIENPETKFKKIHFYAFGGIKKTTDWLKTVNKHDLSYNGQKFE